MSTWMRGKALNADHENVVAAAKEAFEPCGFKIVDGGDRVDVQGSSLQLKRLKDGSYETGWDSDYTSRIRNALGIGWDADVGQAFNNRAVAFGLADRAEEDPLWSVEKTFKVDGGVELVLTDELS